ncbi:hypothetical protein GQ44DRAFT_724371 [Phaeosphaeriaceae sp. PMI808]|nr:hypothetical protein GQ44DRAFT_724371 [Phaeosphaeriaceae sp. PMI808]
MAAFNPHSHSPRVLAHNPTPITPVHSPHHSITSSISSRTPLHTLSIHEYRRQQNTPGSQIVTPSGKTLRRKAAAPSLAGLERVPSLTRATHSVSRSSLRPLHSTQSAQQLHSHPSPFQPQLRSDQLSRSQSAEPRNQGGSISSTSTTTSTGRVRHFNSRKRLPKPAAATSSLPFPPRSTIPRYSVSSDTRTTHTPSSFSLSRFPQPPHREDPSLFPLCHESELTHIAAPHFASTAPVTPPATPATIHYRGTSFDLVNPHDSLLLHDIVTPSREIGSSEYLPVQTFDEAFVNSAEMAPKRALYGDLNAAHAGIMRRLEDASSGSNIDLPLSPTPAVVSPNSSTYESSAYSPELGLAPSPLDVKKAQNDSRFSLRQLTRTLTKRLVKSPKKHHGQELQEFEDPKLQLASFGTWGDFPQPLSETYTPTRQSTYFPVGPTSPPTPTSPVSPQEQENGLANREESRLRDLNLVQRYDTEPLASLIPDDYSTQMGRGDDPRTSMSEGYLHSRPYYDDLDSIYPSSSVYTGDDRPKSNYQQNLAKNRQSNDLLHYSDMSSSNFTGEYNQDSLYRFSIRNNRKSKNPIHEVDPHSTIREKTDTISKIIDQYDPIESTNNTISTGSQELPRLSRLDSDSEPIEISLVEVHHQDGRSIPGLDQFEFELHKEIDGFERGDDCNRARNNQSVFARKPTNGRDLGSPPHMPAPLAPPFQYNKATSAFPLQDSSGMFSNESFGSYGDTRNLLQIPQTSKSSLAAPNQTLHPSSSYSQPEIKSLEPSSSYSQPGFISVETSPSYSQTAGLPSPPTPQAALDEAEQIFEGAIREQQIKEKGIPAMWARRSSGTMLLAKNTNNHNTEDRRIPESHTFNQEVAREGNDADWESDAGNSDIVRDSFDSIADYSSSEGSRNSLGLESDGSLPAWVGRHNSQGVSIYSHPSPIRTHHNPFSSSPLPQLQPHARLHTAPISSSPRSPAASNLLSSTTVPAFHLPTRSEDVLSREAMEQPYVHAPWTDRYAFSDKETQELLASGPNDKILFDYKRESTNAHGTNAMQRNAVAMVPDSSSPLSTFDHADMERENTFEKLCSIGPKGNLTGTPRGTGMHETGSSIADNSSPGLLLSSTSPHSAGYPGFYAAPFEAISSVTRIEQRQPPAEPEYERTLSQITLPPASSELEPADETSPVAAANYRRSLRYSTTFQRAQRRTSRTAVPGQTKLRQMILSPEAARKTPSSVDTTFSRCLVVSERPSTCQTDTPLHPKMSVDTTPTARTLIAHEHSPHLLCPERLANPEDEERRRRLSWYILVWFCLLPPCIILFRIWGDSIIAMITDGHLGHCTPKSKRVALIAGIVVNIGVATAIVVPILVVHALGAA